MDFARAVLCFCLSDSLILIDHLRLLSSINSNHFRYTGHKNTEYRIDSCLDHTDNYVISGSEDGTVYMWSLVEGQMVCRLEHVGNKVVHSLSPHPSKSWLVSAAKNNIYLWKDQPPNDD